MTSVLLVRHGQTAWVSRPRFKGRADLPLSSAGREQCAALSERIRTAGTPVAVYTSPLRRCTATARIIAEPLGLAPRPVDGLVDIDYGAWQGLTHAEVRMHWPLEIDAWVRQPHRAAIPGGETLESVNARACSALYDILREHRAGFVVLVSHGCINRLILLHALHLPLARYRYLVQNVGAINQIDYRGGCFYLRSFNETYHLRQLQHT